MGRHEARIRRLEEKAAPPYDPPVFAGVDQGDGTYIVNGETYTEDQIAAEAAFRNVAPGMPKILSFVLPEGADDA